MSRLFPPINMVTKSNKPVFNQAPDATYHVFDLAGGYHAVQGGQPKICPEGGVMKAPGNDGWYIMRRGLWHRIKREELPAEIRTTMLLLSLNL